MAAEQASAGLLTLTPEGDFASATPKLLTRAEEYHNRMQAARLRALEAGTTIPR